MEPLKKKTKCQAFRKNYKLILYPAILPCYLINPFGFICTIKNKQGMSHAVMVWGWSHKNSPHSGHKILPCFHGNAVMERLL